MLRFCGDALGSLEKQILIHSVHVSAIQDVTSDCNRLGLGSNMSSVEVVDIQIVIIDCVFVVFSSVSCSISGFAQGRQSCILK